MVGIMDIVTTKLTGAVVVETRRLIDHRGSFARLFCANELSDLLGSRRIVQINHSRTVKVGTVRGLHFQRRPHAEMKFVRCLTGRVFDVAVDLRAGSPTFLQWHAEELSAQNVRMLVIPEGCAHGFQSLDPESELLYLHTAPYVPEAEEGVRFDDARIGIRWPLPVAELSQRDFALPTLRLDFAGIPA
jgi:dTDP-4-dehydrorhamnose 3,5-epimerase